MRKVIKGRSYHHPFSTSGLAKPLTEAEKLKALKDGDWDLLIRSHMRLGCSLAGRYVSFGGSSDDMVSAAMLGICHAVERAKEGHMTHDNITGYIVHFIHDFCRDELRRENLIPVPRNSPVKDFKVMEFVDGIYAVDDFEIERFYETLEDIIKTDLEADIIDLRFKGYSDGYIAQTLGISHSTITRTRRQLYERFLND